MKTRKQGNELNPENWISAFQFSGFSLCSNVQVITNLLKHRKDRESQGAYVKIAEDGWREGKRREEKYHQRYQLLQKTHGVKFNM